jgi:hypothetical protein
VLGADVVDYPRCEALYADCLPEVRAQVRGKGFTLYTGLLEDLPVDRSHIVERLLAGSFDVVVFSDIWRHYGWFAQLRESLHKTRAVVLDGADVHQVYPYAGLWWRRPEFWFAPRAHRHFLYFKREWTGDTRFALVDRALPSFFRRLRAPAENLRKIAFSIPEQKIVEAPCAKTKDFPVHIVDPEVAARVPGARTQYAFATEEEYYHDLQASRFGITTKRAGWDCLRHYEIAANGAVPCFRDLHLKPATCAPHGLDAENCINYRSVDELMWRVASITPAEYGRLQRNALAWARSNSTRSRAERFLDEVLGPACWRR